MNTHTDVSVLRPENVHASVERPATEEGYVTPSVDIYHTPDAFVLMLDLPGAEKGSINVSMDRGALVVKAPAHSAHNTDARLLFSEIRGTGYYRAFNLGEGIDSRNVDAQFVDGVLTVKLFKREELKPKEITIRS